MAEKTKKTKGCFDGKTLKMKRDYVIGLAKLASKDEMFFWEQYNDLKKHEKHEFIHILVTSKESRTIWQEVCAMIREFTLIKKKY